MSVAPFYVAFSMRFLLTLFTILERLLAPVVLTLDSAIPRINHYPADKYYGNQLRSPLDSDLSGGLRYPTFEQPRPVDFIILTNDQIEPKKT